MSSGHCANEGFDAYRKAQIVEASERLLAGISFERLTVSDICAEAGISRPTFYRHFRDKFDIAQWLWDQIGERYLRECGRTLGWYESNLKVLREFASHAAFFMAATQGDSDPNACMRHGYRNRREYLRETVASLGPALLTDDVEFQIDFFVDAESRAISAWLRNGMPTSAECLARRIESCVPKQLHDLVERALASYG